MSRKLAPAIFICVATLLDVGCKASVPEPIVKPPDVQPAPQAVKTDAKLDKTEAEKPGYHRERVFQIYDLKRAPVKIDGKTVKVWIMNSESKRQEGMMWLTDKDVRLDEGMLFVFDHSQPLSFWMQNTVLPLDIMYFSSSGKLLNNVQGKPFDETPFPSHGDAQFVVEMMQGSARRLGFHAGSILSIPSEGKVTE